ncbi:hypothetical protein M9434_005207 [Picochlorum sp. BPE23]|nr:hypothetical protein M9434_005207 [Picochlorum sp. BPE23]
MGVKSLWTLLEPCGRRVDVTTLRGKTVAIDASGWIFRFLKAMRDDKGDILPHAHTIGFLRRICKLLYLHIKPVFIFDGSTPALKKRTVAERRRRREQQDARVKKTAEKLLLNRLKQHAVRAVERAKSGVGSNGEQEAKEPAIKGSHGNERHVDNVSKGKAVIEDTNKGSEVSGETDEDEDEDEGGFEVDVDDGVDPEVLSTLPPSMQLEIMLQVREKAMTAARGGFEERSGKPEEFSKYQLQQYLNSTGLRRQLDSIRGIAQQNSDIARPVAAEEDKHYVLYKEEEQSMKQKDSPVQVGERVGKPEKSKSNEALHISFCVEEDEIVSDDMEWEDVDEEPNIEGNTKPTHRSKYWSLSHGFQKGRSLGNWGKKDAVKENKDQIEDVDEERMLQEAIEESLRDSNVAAKVQELPCVDGMDNSAQPTAVDEPTISEDEVGEKSLPCVAGASAKIQYSQKNSKACDPKREESEQAPAIQVLTRAAGDCKETRKNNISLTEGAIQSSKDAIGLVEPASLKRLPNEEPLGKHIINAPEVSCERLNTETISLTNERDKMVEIRTDAGISEEVLNEQMEKDKPNEQLNKDDGIKKPIEGAEEEQNVMRDSYRKLINETEIPMVDMEKLLSEEASLRADRRAATGQSDSPTDQMFTECQELLQMFGIPYLVAPTEAEAQCAWLDANNLVDAVVTDDNDAFLFGAKKVYRHIFEESKYVEEYRMEDIERELGLSRDSLIYLGLLLGSDYTPGIAGVGVVNAVEIVSSFPGYDGLIEFEKWVNGIDEDIVALVKEKCATSAMNETTEEFKQKHKAVRNSWLLPEDFPSKEVVQAYQNPLLDKSKSKFTFISPDFKAVSLLCSKKFGWDEKSIDDLLSPVKKSLEEREKQQTLDSFVTFREKFAKVRSKRLAKAVDGIKKKAKLRPAANDN